MPILVTGVAGFIGFHVASRLLGQGQAVVGLDNVNSYYSPQLKRDRVAQLLPQGLEWHELDLTNQAGLLELFRRHRFEKVIHLAAQPGVRYSLENPQAYVDSNLTGFINVLEACRAASVGHLVYASSSSVYGANKAMPFSTRQTADHPLALYGATKRANELIAHAYASSVGLPVTGLRFFTVYGPWGRPDMAILKFARAIVTGQPLGLYNHGRLQRDFTYVDDIVDGVLAVTARTAAPDPAWDPQQPTPDSSSAPYRVYNLGAHRPVELEYFVQLLERELGMQAIRTYLPMQVGDVLSTYADVEDSRRDFGFDPQVSIEDGVARSMRWYREYRLRNPEV